MTQQAGGVVYLPHPHAWDDDPAFFLDPPRTARFDGIEVVNGTPCDTGSRQDPAGTRGFARRLWDGILSARVSCWGYGNDDMHTHGVEGGAEPFGSMDRCLV